MVEHQLAISPHQTKSLSTDNFYNEIMFHRLLPGVSKMDFKKAVGSLLQTAAIEISSNDITLITENQVSSSPIMTTLYMSNIHADTKSPVELKSFISQIFLKSPVILDQNFTLQLQDPSEDTPPHQSFLKLKNLRLKPLTKSISSIDGQSVGSDSSSDRYQKKDSRIGFLDITWNHPDISSIEKYQNHNIQHLKKQIEQLSIQLLHQKIFHGKKLKVALPRNSKKSEIKYSVSSE